MMSSTESVERSVRTLLRRGTRLNNDERFDAARPFFAIAHARAMHSLGEDADLTLEALNCLALCNFNRMDYEVALQHYSALLERLRRVLPGEDELVIVTQASVLRCQTLVSAGQPLSVAEFVFRSFFSNEEEHAQFVLEHGVRIERGERLDPQAWVLLRAS